MSVQGFTARFAGSVRRAHLLAEAKVFARSDVRTAGEADPVPDSQAPNDEPVPAEHTSPEDVSPGKTEDGDESFEHEVRRIDPNHFADRPDTTAARTAGMVDDLDPAQAAGGDPAPAGPSSDPVGPVPSQPTPAPTPEKPEAPKPPAEDAPSKDTGGAIFDWVNGLDPVARGQLVNDWQQNVDPKLFSRHTNVLKMEADGDTLKLHIQAFNTDAGAKPDLSTGYAADGQERGELMMHLREVFQPNGPAVNHVLGVYNGFFEDQADQGAMPLLRVKVGQSAFQFQPNERVIEGWSDAGLGADPQWKKTPYSVYTVLFALTFVKIGGAASSPPAAPAAPPAPGQGAA